MKLFSSIAAAPDIGSSVILASPIEAVKKPEWPKQIGYPPKAYSMKSRSEIPSFPSHVDGFLHVTGRDCWNRPINERGQVRAFGSDKWESITDFPRTTNGCHNGVFLLRWRLSKRSGRSVIEPDTDRNRSATSTLTG